MPDYPVPVTHDMFTSGAPASTALEEASTTEGDSSSGTEDCPLKKWGITKLTISCDGETSASFDDPKHPQIAGDKTQRFCIAPKDDAAVIKWTLENPDNATTLTLELYRAGDGAAIWTRTLDAKATKAVSSDWDGSFNADEWTRSDLFPHGMLTAEHSPYMLKAIAGTNAETAKTTRWTYIDVIVEKLELLWGGRAIIPATVRNDIDNDHRAKSVAGEAAINDYLVTKTAVGGTLDPADVLNVDLPCNRFIDWMYDFDEVHDQRKSTLYLKHKEQWGGGVRVPLKAKIFLRKADGSSVHGGESAKALGGTRFLWDWHSRDEIAGLGARALDGRVQTFLSESLDYKRTDPTGPADSTNCHEEHGGKRGPNSQVFPDIAPADFPFTVNRCTDRVWASYSTAELTGMNAGFTGVLFQPSRMAGDTYKVRVYAPLDGGNPDTLDVQAKTPAGLRSDYTDLAYAESGTFVINRKIRVRYVRKAGTMTSAVLATIGEEYAKANVILDWGTTVEQTADETRLHANYDTWFNRIVNDNVRDHTGAVDAAQPHKTASVRNHTDKLANVTHFDAGTGAGVPYTLLAKDYDVVKHEIKVATLRDYVMKARKFNGPKRAYERARVAGVALDATNDAAWLLQYYNGLSRKKTTKVDALIVAAEAAASLHPNAASYRADIEGVGVFYAKHIAQQLMIEAGEDSLVILHCDSPAAFLQQNGTIDQPPSSTGGLSPSNGAKFDGRGSIHMVFLPQIPSADPTAKYHSPVTSVITHEMGHNMFLNHAPATAGIRVAPGRRPELHDAADLKCLMNYDQTSDHLCGYCHLKLRGWGTTPKGGKPMDDALVELSNTAATNHV